jgi:hypothetical protein
MIEHHIEKVHASRVLLICMIVVGVVYLSFKSKDGIVSTVVNSYIIGSVFLVAYTDLSMLYSLTNNVEILAVSAKTEGSNLFPLFSYICFEVRLKIDALLEKNFCVL